MCLDTKHMDEDKVKIGKILEAINEIIIIEKQRVVLDNEIKLFPSEINLIMFIHLRQNKNITEISKKLGLTKGAISQTLSRLEKKGLLTKKNDSKNKNELQLYFTEKGKNTLNKLMNIKLSIGNGIMQYFQGLANHDKQIIQEFIEEFVLILRRSA